MSWRTSRRPPADADETLRRLPVGPSGATAPAAGGYGVRECRGGAAALQHCGSAPESGCAAGCARLRDCSRASCSRLSCPQRLPQTARRTPPARLAPCWLPRPAAPRRDFGAPPRASRWATRAARWRTPRWRARRRRATPPRRWWRRARTRCGRRWGTVTQNPPPPRRSRPRTRWHSRSAVRARKMVARPSHSNC